MADLATIAAIPGVASAVLGDGAGGFYDAIREPDGESVAAVTGFIATGLAEVGEQLGLGPLARASIAGPTRACMILSAGGALVTAAVSTPAALPNVERALDQFLHSRG